MGRNLVSLLALSVACDVTAGFFDLQSNEVDKKQMSLNDLRTVEISATEEQFGFNSKSKEHCNS